MKYTKKLISLLLGCVVASSMISMFSFSVHAETPSEESFLTTGDGLWVDPVENGFPRLEEKIVNSRTSSSVDNSDSIYFPAIGNQGQMNSCAGWASTYYQYTYEVNRLKGVATTTSNTYSPSWTYNYINGGTNAPTSILAAYDILENQGALLLSDYPHPIYEWQYSYTWCSNLSKMVDALHYRLTPGYESVANTTESEIGKVKSRLEDGHIATIWTNASGWDIHPSTSGENVIIRGSSGNGGHYMTVVGYDDSITVNYNGVTFTGAFKLANSWGTESTWSTGNDGFIWVAYDALNEVSSYGTQWQSGYSTTRTTIFGVGNPFYFVTANYYPCYYVGQATYFTNDPWNVKVFGDISTTATTTKFCPYPTGLTNLNGAVLGVIVFDYFTSTSQNVANYINSSFTTKISNSFSSNTYHIYLALIDSKCKKIMPNDTVYGSLPSNGGNYSRTFNISLKKGRISNYDNGNLTAADASLLQSYLLGAESFSSLQFYLADMDYDESVDYFDYLLLQQAIAAQNSEAIDVDTLLSEYIPELNKTLRDCIYAEFGEEGIEYAESLFA